MLKFTFCDGIDPNVASGLVPGVGFPDRSHAAREGRCHTFTKAAVEPYTTDPVSRAAGGTCPPQAFSPRGTGDVPSRRL